MRFLVTIMIFLAAFSSCATDTQSSSGSDTLAAKTSNTKHKIQNGFKVSDKGVHYKVVTNKPGNKATFGDFLELNFSYATEKDSIIYSTFNMKKPITFKFTDSMFRGMFKEGIENMAKGDSAVFKVEAKTMFGSNMPRYFKEDDMVKYIIKLESINPGK